MLLWVILMLSMLLVLKPEGAQASHFRYGHLTWQRISPTGNNVRLTLVNAFRRQAVQYPGTAPDGFVAVGDIINEDVGSTVMFFGDGNTTSVLQYKVISIDVANDWFLAQALEPGSSTKTTIDHTYASATNGGAPWLAEIFSCCRTGVEVNNPNGNYRVSTLVELASGNASPVSGLPAIVNLPQDVAATFFVPAADADPNTSITWRLATASEAGGTFNQPTGLTINSATGLVTWNTLVNAVLGGLYSCQVIIEDHNATTGALKTQVAVDFLIFITTQTNACAGDLPPYFVNPLSIGIPTCGLVYNIIEGLHLSFITTAADPDAGNVVTLNSGGGPAGSTFTPNLPTTGNPVSSTFDWTPGVGTAGAYIVTFTATDSCGLQALCSSTINVSANPCHIKIGCRPTQPTCWNSCDGSITVNITGGSGQYGYLWSNGETTKTISGLCAGTYTITVTDLVTQCQKSKVLILKKAKIGHKFTKVHASCGLCNGSITVIPSGGNGAPFTYLWSTGATTATLSQICGGTYTVTITDKLGCTKVCASSIINQLLVNCPSRLSGDASADAKQIVAYPNPFSDQLTINVTTDENLIVKIQDVTGRVISVYQNVNQTFVMNEKLNSGLYFINIENELGTYRQVLKVVRSE